MKCCVPFRFFLLPLLVAAAEGTVNKGDLLRTVDTQSRSVQIEEELKAWKDLGNDPYVREQKKELTKQLNAVRRDDAERRRRVVSCLEKVLKTGDINARNGEGQTLLMAVANTGADEATRAVLNENPDLSLTDDAGHTALWYEMRGMGHALNTLLLQRWRAAMEAADANAAEQLIDSGISPSTPTAKGNPPLGEAIERGAEELMAVLMKQDTLQSSPMADGRSLMEVAVEKGNARAISYLLTFGADADTRLSTGETPLRYLLRRGQTDAVLAFLKGADLGNAAEPGTRVCCLAARFAPAETVRALLAAVENPHEEDSCGNTPLSEAARRGNIAVYDAVLESDPPAWKNSRGETVLMHAALSGSEAMLRRVLETMPAELRDSTDAADRRAADYAALLPNPEPLQALLAQPAE